MIGALEVDHHFADGVFVKAITIAQSGSLVPQHAHGYGHTSFLASGEVLAWKDREFLGRFTAPTGIFIEAGTKHAFLTTAPNTVLLCIHNLHGAEAVMVLEEHEFAAQEVAELLSKW